MGRSSSPHGSGFVSIVLHAHMPYIRNPEYPYHLEERWLFEAITETYIPLLSTFDRLINDNVDFRITLSLTPTLIEMFRDRLLMERYQKYLAALIELSEKELRRTRTDACLYPLARMYRRRFAEVQRLFEEVHGKDLTSAFASLAASDKMAIMTSAATHAYLPAMMATPAAARAQILIGTRHYRRVFGKRPQGIWLPECGYVPELEPLLKQAGIRFFFLESHGLLNSTPPSPCGIFVPARTPSGLYAFSRDASSSRQVWSATEGYPGDFDYRDFYRDIGFDLDFGYLKPYLPEGVRTFTGLKYFRITGRQSRKLPYLPEKALRKAKIHAAHFTRSREEQIRHIAHRLKIQPVITAAYDAELFGHWWFEGPAWLEFFFRDACAPRQKTFRLTTPPEYLAEGGLSVATQPSPSSWGAKGYSSTWVDDSNVWTYRHLSRAARLMRSAAIQHRNARGIMRRALNQASRELLLAQSSDWAFMMNTTNAAGFGKEQFTEHMRSFLALHRQIIEGVPDREFIESLEKKDNLFSEMDFRIFADPDQPQARSLSKG